MRLRWMITALLLAIALLLAHPVGAETWRFAVIGDTPYNSYEARELGPMLEDVAAAHVSFIVHAGDFKDSGAVCSDELFENRRSLLDASPAPLIYVPGDNEWVDCRRLGTGLVSVACRATSLSPATRYSSTGSGKGLPTPGTSSHSESSSSCRATPASRSMPQA